MSRQQAEWKKIVFVYILQLFSCKLLINIDLLLIDVRNLFI